MNIEIDVVVNDYGREVVIYITDRFEGQYYYLMPGLEGVDRFRQCNTEEVKPFIRINYNIAKLLCKALLEKLPTPKSNQNIKENLET